MMGCMAILSNRPEQPSSGLQKGAKVTHPTFGVGVVCDRTAHTHKDYTVVFFPTPKSKFKDKGSKGQKRRVLTDDLTEIVQHNEVSDEDAS